MGHALDYILPVALAVVGNSIVPGIGAPVGAALGSGGLEYSKTHNFGDALKAGALSGGGSFVGGNIGNALLPNMGTVGGTFLGSGASSDIASSLGSSAGNLLSTPLSQAAGSYAGSTAASQFVAPGQPSNIGNYPFVPSSSPTGATPSSLNSMSSLTPQQQASGLATQGVYGGGLGPQEQGYFKNLVNNQLTVGAPSGGTNPLSDLSPIENTYLGNLGFGSQSNSYDLAKALSQWNPST